MSARLAEAERLERRRLIVMAYTSGEPLDAIGARFGISRQRVERIARQDGAPYRLEGCGAKRPEFRTALIEADVAAAIRREALRRQVKPEALVSAMLRAIVDDALFDAVLDS